MFSIMKLNTKTTIMVVVAAVFLFQEPVDASSNFSCGQLYQSRIIGGENARRWPWQAHILVDLYGDGNFQVLCGGSLINDEWVVTAAHCVIDSKSPADLRVILGDYNRAIDDKTEQYYNVTDFRVHYNFSTTIKGDNDIALVKLNKRVKYTSAVGPICLPKQNKRVAVGTKCFVTGWGYIRYESNNTIAPAILQEVELPVVNHSICSQGMKQYNPVDDHSMLCAGYGKLSNKTGCYGDSGGPFSCFENGKYVLRGVSSWIDMYCKTTSNTFTVFARVSSFSEWIRQQMIIPRPTFRVCKDYHWACATFAKRKYCTNWMFKYIVKNKYCRITCKDPKCITPSTKNNKKMN